MKDYQDMVREQLPEVAEENIMVEPINRNTGPAVSWATVKMLKRNANARMMVTPSDQMITDDTAFANDMLKALDSFMAVGTHGYVRFLPPADLHTLGAQAMLSNGFHLRRQSFEIAKQGGLANWKGGACQVEGELTPTEGARSISEKCFICKSIGL